jgi:hypothetical protein
LQERLKHAAPYWENYARRHTQAAELIQIIELMLYIKDAGISQTILSSYKLPIFCAKNIKNWIQLIQSYGSAWFLAIFKSISNKLEIYCYEERVIKNFSSIIRSLKVDINDKKLIDTILDYQFISLKSKHTDEGKKNNRERAKKEPNRIAEMTDFLLSAIYSENKKVHLEALDYVISHPDIYSALSLVSLFKKCCEQLRQSTANAWGYDKLFVYLNQTISGEYQQGLRAKNDWSIIEKMPCACEQCKILKKFLNASDEQHKKWPLVEHLRAHVEEKISFLAVPVSVHTEKTSRPYTLVLSKTAALYDESKKKYTALEKAIAELGNKERVVCV